jgi:hypothetical protein
MRAGKLVLTIALDRLADHYASGTEARQRQDPQGLDPKGDGPAREAGDAQA